MSVLTFVGYESVNLFAFTKEKVGAMIDKKNDDAAVHGNNACNGIYESTCTSRIR
ncbi:hypothetical protein MGA3_07030 [Bacillus methanolicus MGA3]|nr:hypothetical protein MGA3_07030 [Bacillus methanolicus MGA3]